MLEIKKSRKAQTDLRECWKYSYRKWDIKQANTYYDLLVKAIDGLAGNPEIGRKRDDVKVGIRSIQVKKHTIYYKVTSQTIVIIRVIHGSMLAKKHL